MEENGIREHITNISELTDEELSLLISCASTHNLKKGEILLNEGEMCRSIYWVKQGYLRTWFNKDGAAINLNFTFEGEFTSNVRSIKNKQPSDVVIEAGEDAVVWVFNLNAMSGKFEKYPQISIFFRRIFVRLLLKAEEHTNLFKMYTPAERYKYIEKNNPALLQRISLSHMASYLGMARETLSRIRGKNI